jgi:hypothetical protein
MQTATEAAHCAAINPQSATALLRLQSPAIAVVV